MKTIENQLSLFDQILEEKFRTKADDLLTLLNQDLKPKDHYVIHFYYVHNDYYILIAFNREKHLACNVVDVNGNMPKDFDVCWRNHSHIVQELRQDQLKN